MARALKGFGGNQQQLRYVVALTKRPGEWQYMPAEYWRFVCDDNAILNWFPTTGALNFQGPAVTKLAFEQAMVDVVSQLRETVATLQDQRNA